MKVLNLVKADLPYWTHISAVVLPLRPMDLDSWITDMENPLQACDELLLFMLNHLHLCHTVVFTKTCPWSTICTCESMSDDQLYTESDLHLVYFGQDVYGESREKPVLLNKPNDSFTSKKEDNTPSTPCADSSQQSMNNKVITANVPVVNTTAAKLAESEKLKHIMPPVHSLTIGMPEERGEHCTVSAAKFNSILPPLLSIVLPLRLLIVDYLKTCTSPLVNPVVGYTMNISNVSNTVNSSDSLLSIPDSSPAVKSQNTEMFNLDDVLVSSACERNYNVIVKKLSTDDINLWTGHVPLWSKIDPYSSILDIQTDSSDAGSTIETEHKTAPLHNL